MPAIPASHLQQLIAAAARAPSGHNTQPWLFAAEGSEISIRPDFTRRLPVVDGGNRELFISLGCAAENLCIQASILGYAVQTRSGSEGIRLTLRPDSGAAADPLAAHIAARQTNRAPYNGRIIPEDTLQTILRWSSGHSVRIQAFPQGSHTFRLLARAVADGNNTQLADPAFKAELLSWIRFNKKHAEHTRDGISYAALGAPDLPRWISEPIVRAMLNAKTQNRADRRKIQSSSHLALVSSPADTPAGHIAVGRSLQRFLLRLTQHGIAHAYLNPPCEVPALRRRLQTELFADSGDCPQLLLRLGYAAPLPPSLRRDAAQVWRQPPSDP